jgi:transposase-like protein
MSDDNVGSLNRTFLHERDARIFAMRKAGTSTAEIAKRFGISSRAVNNAVRRQLTRLDGEAAMAYPELVRMELERLDALQQALWPLTQHRLVDMGDGDKVPVEPDQKAVQTVLSIMDRRSKLLGMGTMQINLDVAHAEMPQRVVLADAADRPAAADAFDARTEATRLIELMLQSGVLPADQARALLGHDVTSATDARALGAGEVWDADGWDDDDDDDDDDGDDGDDDSDDDRPLTPDEVYE